MAVEWCDGADHAFKAGQRGSTRMAGTEVNDDGMAVTVEMNYCRDHNPFRRQYEDAELKVLTEKAAQELREKNL